MEKENNEQSIEHEWVYMDKGGIGWLCPFCGNVKDDIFIIPDGWLVCADCMKILEDTKTAMQN